MVKGSGKGGFRRYARRSSRSNFRNPFQLGSSDADGALDKVITRLTKALSSLQNNNDDLNNYDNVSKLVKLWIIQDQRRKNSIKKPSEQKFDFQLVQNLPLDLRYEIIDFIPTYSYKEFYKHKLQQFTDRITEGKISKQDLSQIVCKGLNLFETFKKRSFDNLYQIDAPYITYYKKRLISRDYALRMKKKILTLDHFDLSNDEIKIGKLEHFFSLVKEMNDTIDYNDVVIHHHIDKIKSLIHGLEEDQNSDSSDMSDEDDSCIHDKPNIPVIDSNPTLRELQVLSDEEIKELESQTLENLGTNGERDIPMMESIIEKEDSLLKQNIYFGHNTIPIELMSGIDILPPRGRLPYMPTNRLRMFIDFIGVNTSLKKIELNQLIACEGYCNLYHLILDICKGITKLSLHVYEEMEDVEILMETLSKLDELCIIGTIGTWKRPINYIGKDDILQYLKPNCIVDIGLNGIQVNHTLYVNGKIVKEEDNKNDAFQIHSTSLTQDNIKEYFDSLKYSEERFNSEITNAFSFFDINMKKKIIDYLVFDLDMSIESILPLIEHNDIIYEYLAYLSNTYQNGVISNPNYIMIESGLNPSNVANELVFINREWKIVKLFLDYLKNTQDSNEFVLTLRSLLILYMKVKSESAPLFELYSYIKKNVSQSQFREILKPVKCVVQPKHREKYQTPAIVSIPLISFPFRNYQVAKALSEDMSDEI